MYMPASILPGNPKVGADSEGQATIESMQASQEAATSLQRRQTMQIWVVAGTLFVVIFAYTRCPYMERRHNVRAVPQNTRAVRPSRTVYGRHTGAPLW